MSKILTTQLTGLFNAFNNLRKNQLRKQHDYCTGGIGEGKVYFACFGEMEAVAMNAEMGRILLLSSHDDTEYRVNDC